MNNSADGTEYNTVYNEYDSSREQTEQTKQTEQTEQDKVVFEQDDTFHT